VVSTPGETGGYSHMALSKPDTSIYQSIPTQKSIFIVT